MAEKKEFVDKDNLIYYTKKLFTVTIKSTDIREIKIVDELPEIEEDGVLYLVNENQIPTPPPEENLWTNPTVIEGWFETDASYATVEIGNNSYYAYISCEPNTTYQISRTLNGYRFMVGTSETEPNEGTTYFTNYINADAMQQVEITSGINDHFLAIYYKGSSESIDADELLNDITVKIKE